MELSISILNAKDRRNMIKTLNETNISYLHLDVMDGNFVPNKEFSKEEIIEFSQISEKKLDIHLMVNDPIEYIEIIKNIPNIEYVTIHFEIEKDIKNILSKIKSYGIKTGLSIKPNTDINKLLPFIEDIDLVLLMTVEPGEGGQKFISSSSKRLEELSKILNNNIKIEVDGGINDETINCVKGADIAVVGSYITTSDNPIEKINNLLV